MKEVNAMIDTHCHLTSKGLVERTDEVVAAAREDGVEKMITIGTSLDDSQKAIEIAGEYEGVFATVGLHPHEWVEGTKEEDFKEEMRGILKGWKEKKVVGIGEIGLDYFYDEPGRNVQKMIFGWQLDVCVEEEFKAIPIVIHNREATDDTIGMLKEAGIEGERCDFHCFTGSVQEMEKILAYGATIGFTGAVTFKSAEEIREACKLVPIERMVLETDSPYMTPAPYRKIRPNEPKFVKVTAKFLAESRGMSEEEFVKVVDGNAERFFGI